MSSERIPAQGSQVHHARFGTGVVLMSSPDAGTVIVRFDSGLQECRVEEVAERTALEQRLFGGVPDDAGEVIARVQAEAIHSVNQTWGVFAPSRIQLLPHQLWVCKKVLERWPTRWLIADDVGLGKTIEAGLILWPLIARGSVRRLLVLCPASLVPQWQQRMREMFDIRMTEYTTQVDTAHADFWNTHHFVVASLQTLRSMSSARARERRTRLVDAEVWDLVVVDEAHHLNVEEHGETQGYALLRELQDAGRITSLLLFTATPHRGKHRGFFSLMQLLRGDLFDAARPLEPQLPLLAQAVIRNNKQRVTDLRGERLFQTPSVRVKEFAYSREESAFYQQLTEFILGGRAYASHLGAAGQSVGLVLTALQKLAASSVAAVRRAIRGRLHRLKEEVERHRTNRAASSDLAPASREIQPDEGEEDLDRVALLEERLVQELLRFQLVENEIPALEELLAAADAVTEESKLRTLMALLVEELPDRSVLLFTEYKATQALVVSALRARFGEDCVGFINGDDSLSQVDDGRGAHLTLQSDRRAVAAAFNEGRLRFLVSTEAAGEGIDLQGNCHTLVHLDVPWNPMRIHQRNGRLYRYGQASRVEVITLRNPETVEARIWDLLTERMHEIERTLVEVMDDPEDLSALVLGMTPARAFERVFERAAGTRPERLDEWFRAESASFAGRPVIDTVRDIFGNVARFDFQEVAEQVPKVDLTDLESFMKRTMMLMGRRLAQDERGLYSLIAPGKWRGLPGIRRKYEGLTFDRHARAGETVLSAGHRLVLQSIEWARTRDASYALVGGLNDGCAVLKLLDRVTTNAGQVQTVVIGIRFDPGSGQPSTVLRDWELLLALNRMTAPRAREKPDRVVIDTQTLSGFALERVTELALPFEKPLAEVIAVLLPASLLANPNEVDANSGAGGPE